MHRAPAMTAPRWLTQHLLDTGATDAHGITRHARPRHCKRCSAPVIAGLDADAAAGTAIADLTPLSAQTELAALLSARRTYTLWVDKTGILLEHRNQFDTANGIPKDKHIIPEHRCHRILGEHLTVTPPRPPVENEEPPF